VSCHAIDADADAQLGLINVKPTSTAGVAAVLAYAVEVEKINIEPFLPFEDDDGRSRSFGFLLMRNCAETLVRLSASA
jgi:hypothetical protein